MSEPSITEVTYRELKSVRTENFMCIISLNLTLALQGGETASYFIEQSEAQVFIQIGVRSPGSFCYPLLSPL